MRLGHVIGTVTLGHALSSLRGGRLLVVSPLDSDTMASACTSPPRISAQPSVVAYDHLGAGRGDVVGFVEGGEATAPFDQPIPLDALIIALIDSLHYDPAPATPSPSTP